MRTSGEPHPDKGCGSKFAKNAIVQSLAYRDKTKWFQDMRQSLSLTASIIATISFQSAVDPPGGSGLSGEKRVYYLPFLICNTICFISSLSVCLLLVSGLSLENTTVTWFLLVGMCITITSLLVTYLFGAMIAIPDDIIINIQPDSAFAIVMIVWAALFTLVSFLLILGFVSSKNNRNNEQAAGEQELAKRPVADP